MYVDIEHLSIKVSRAPCEYCINTVQVAAYTSLNK